MKAFNFFKTNGVSDNLTTRMKFLLNQADLYAHFLLSRNDKHKNQKKPMQASNKKRSYLNEEDEEDDLLE